MDNSELDDVLARHARTSNDEISGALQDAPFEQLREEIMKQTRPTFTKPDASRLSLLLGTTAAAVLLLVVGIMTWTNTDNEDEVVNQPPTASQVQFSSTVIDEGNGPTICIGIVNESYPPQCDGYALDGLTMSPNWAETEGDISFGERTVIVEWPATDGRLTVLHDRELTADDRPPEEEQSLPLPNACAGLSPDQLFDVELLGEWAEDNPELAGTVYLADTRKEGVSDSVYHTSQRIGVLQVVEEAVDDVRAELRTSNKQSCIEGVAFSRAELLQQQLKIEQARESHDELQFFSSGFAGAENKLQVEVAVADGTTIRIINEIVDDPDMVQVKGWGTIVE